MELDTEHQLKQQTTLKALLSQRLHFWINLTEEEQKALVSHTRFARFKAGDQVRNPSSPAGVMLVLSGNLRAYMLSEEGKQITLFRIGEQESCVLAASCALTMITFDVFLDAASDTELLIIDSAFMPNSSKRTCM